MAVAEIDLNLVSQIRKEMPCFQHRRSDLYELKAKDCGVLQDISSIFKFADKIIPGETVFYQSSYSFAFTNIRCVVPGRILYFNFFV